MALQNIIGEVEKRSGQSADGALAKLCERLVFVTPDLLRKSTPEGLADNFFTI